MYEAGNALRRNVALLCCSFQSFLKIFLIPKAFAVFFFSGAAKPRFFVPSQFVSRSAQPLDPLRENIVFYTARYLINEREERVYVDWSKLAFFVAKRKTTKRCYFLIYELYVTVSHRSIYFYSVVKIVNIYKPNIYKAVFLMAVIRN